MPVLPVTKSLRRGFYADQLGKDCQPAFRRRCFAVLNNEFAMAQEAERQTLGGRGGRGGRGGGPVDPNAVRLTSNENPLGPCPEAIGQSESAAFWMALFAVR